MGSCSSLSVPRSLRAVQYRRACAKLIQQYYAARARDAKDDGADVSACARNNAAAHPLLPPPPPSSSSSSHNNASSSVHRRLRSLPFLRGTRAGGDGDGATARGGGGAGDGDGVCNDMTKDSAGGSSTRKDGGKYTPASGGRAAAATTTTTAPSDYDAMHFFATMRVALCALLSCDTEAATELLLRACGTNTRALDAVRALVVHDRVACSSAAVDAHRALVMQLYIQHDRDGSGDLSLREVGRMARTFDFPPALQQDLHARLVQNGGALPYAVFERVYLDAMAFHELDPVYDKLVVREQHDGQQLRKDASGACSSNSKGDTRRVAEGATLSLDGFVAFLRDTQGICGTTDKTSDDTSSSSGSSSGNNNEKAEHKDTMGGDGCGASSSSSSLRDAAVSMLRALGCNDAAAAGVSRRLFCDYLISSRFCDVLQGARTRQVTHDMHQPLCHYFINSSHNTYLTGDQLRSRSSVSMYRRVLLAGCRCVELDCWNGRRREPVVYHGYTRTSRISFRACITTIRKYAFAASPYPVVLSLEVHTSIAQQDRMAEILRDVLGDMLFVPTWPAGEAPPAHLITPDALRHKILVKAQRCKGDRRYGMHGVLLRHTPLSQAIHHVRTAAVRVGGSVGESVTRRRRQQQPALQQTPPQDDVSTHTTSSDGSSSRSSNSRSTGSDTTTSGNLTVATSSLQNNKSSISSNTDKDADGNSGVGGYRHGGGRATRNHKDVGGMGATGNTASLACVRHDDTLCSGADGAADALTGSQSRSATVPWSGAPAAATTASSAMTAAKATTAAAAAASTTAMSNSTFAMTATANNTATNKDDDDDNNNSVTANALHNTCAGQCAASVATTTHGTTALMNSDTKPPPSAMSSRVAAETRTTTTPSAATRSTVTPPRQRRVHHHSSNADDEDEDEDADEAQSAHVSRKLSACVVIETRPYEGTRGLHSLSRRHACQCCSYSEKRARRLVRDRRPHKRRRAANAGADDGDDTAAAALTRVNKVSLARIFPAGTRVGSSNYQPMPFWACGCHMVALNWQSPRDFKLRINTAFFAVNGGCGYVLKPPHLRMRDVHTVPLDEYAELTVNVLSAFCLRKPAGRATVSPHVRLHVRGPDGLTAPRTTAAVADNSFHPVWATEATVGEHEFTWPVCHWSLSLLVLQVCDGAYTRSGGLLGEAVLPLPLLERGYRRVQLCDADGNILTGSCVLCYFSY